jgi:xylulokinase
MGTTRLVGIDVGTQGIKAAMYDENLKIAASAYVPLRLKRDEMDHLVQDPDEIFDSVVLALKELVSQTGISQIDGIGISGQMAGIIAIDEDWDFVYPYDSWLDTQCEPYVHLMRDYSYEIVSSSGGQVTCAHGPKILWMKDVLPERFERACKFITLSCYVTGRLCGLKAKDSFVDHTHLHFSGFADNQNGKWNNDLLNAFLVPYDKMPEIVSPDKIVGVMDENVSKFCGIDKGTVVVAGMGDTMASITGAGVVEKGIAFDVAGTASVFSLSTDKFIADTKYNTIMCARSPIENLWIGYAYISGGGLCLRWIKDLLKGEYEVLDDMASKVEAGSANLYFIPHFAGRTCPSVPSVKGAFMGLDWKHGDAHMYRAVMESIAYEYSLYYDILNEHGATASVIHGAGGGSKSHVFNFIKASVMNLPYVPVKNTETATLAMAGIAGYAIGAIKNLKEAICVSSQKGDVVDPNGTLYLEYCVHRKRYKEILEGISRIYNEV